MELLLSRAPWFVTGPGIGLAVVLLLWATRRPLGAVGSFESLIAGRGKQDPRIGLLLGVFLGGLGFALFGPGLTLTYEYGAFDSLFTSSIPGKALLLVVAGFLMGFGARMSGGCTSGHGVCGTALGSPASWVATCCFMATAMAVAAILGVLS